MTRPLWEIANDLTRLRAERKAARGSQTFKAGVRSRGWKPEGPGQRDPRQLNDAFIAWLHIDTACIACLIEGKPMNPHGLQNTIEAAHQNLAIAGKDWRERGLGKRIHDARCVPLCTLHHTGLPNACDNGQRKFWDRLGLGDGIADFCADLKAAFDAGRPAMPVIQDHARRAAANDDTDQSGGFGGGPSKKQQREAQRRQEVTDASNDRDGYAGEAEVSSNHRDAA